jgi:hypothetical protein
MTKNKALDLALEALKELVAQTEARLFAVKYDHVALQNAREAITAIKQDLAAPVQEPVGVAMADYMALTEKYVALKATATKRELVKMSDERIKGIFSYHGQFASGKDLPLLRVIEAMLKESTPLQRTWVSLTDEEMQALWDRYAHMEMMRAIEAKLKEKNT